MQLKTIQEVITLVVFSFFSVLYLGQSIRWNHVAGFAMIVCAVALIFRQWWVVEGAAVKRCGRAALWAALGGPKSVGS